VLAREGPFGRHRLAGEPAAGRLAAQPLPGRPREKRSTHLSRPNGSAASKSPPPRWAPPGHRPGRGDNAISLWVCPWPRAGPAHQDVRSQGSAQLSLNAQPADHVRTRVLEGTSALCRPAQPGGVLAADSCGCGSAGEGGTLGVRHRVALHQIRQHAPGAVGGPARGRARGHPARGPADPHRGMRGNRGPSSLSWAILTGASRWGLTMVRVEPATRPEELRSAGGAAAHRPVGT
jgi:hypothetical protein